MRGWQIMVYDNTDILNFNNYFYFSKSLMTKEILCFIQLVFLLNIQQWKILQDEDN